MKTTCTMQIGKIRKNWQSAVCMFSTECQDYDLSHKEGNWRRSCMSWLISTRGMGSKNLLLWPFSLPSVCSKHKPTIVDIKSMNICPAGRERHLAHQKWIKLLSCKLFILKLRSYCNLLMQNWFGFENVLKKWILNHVFNIKRS